MITVILAMDRNFSGSFPYIVITSAWFQKAGSVGSGLQLCVVMEGRKRRVGFKEISPFSTPLLFV